MTQVITVNRLCILVLGLRRPGQPGDLSACRPMGHSCHSVEQNFLGTDIHVSRAQDSQRDVLVADAAGGTIPTSHASSSCVFGAGKTTL